MHTVIDPHRFRATKRAFTTRNVSLQSATRLTHSGEPKAGDLVLARVTHLGQHQRIELTTGRRSRLFVGDEILVAYGNRYATDQFEATVPDRLEACCLVAAGGIAARFESRSQAVRLPTRIDPIGFVCREDSSRINVRDHGLERGDTDATALPTWVVVGSGMNAGKTTTVAGLIRGATQQGVRVAALKITGTGAGGDLWHYLDAGAQCALDFTDAGHASTAGLDTASIEAIADTLLSHVQPHVDLAIVEIADGLLQRETAALLHDTKLVSHAQQVVFATADPMAAESGVRRLRDCGIEPRALSGAITASSLACREAEAATGIATLTKQALADGAMHRNIPSPDSILYAEQFHAPTAAAS